MESIVIFDNPLILSGYGAALLIGIYGIWKRVGGFWMPLLSAVCCAVTTTYALLNGASFYEVGMMMLVFLLLNIPIYKKEDGDKEDENEKRHGRKNL